MVKKLKYLPVFRENLFEPSRILIFVALIVVRYGEIGLKGIPIRRRFEQLLIQDLKKALTYAGVYNTITTTRGRVFIEVDDPTAASDVLNRVFGITSFSVVEETSADLPAITTAAVSAANFAENEQFAIRVTRIGNHDFTSQDVAVTAGQAIVDVTGAPVNLGEPQHEIFIEIRDRRAFIFTERIHGPGGLPYGSQGTTIAVIQNEEDLLAAWLIMRRGCVVTIVCPKALADQARALYPWQNIKIHTCTQDMMSYGEEISSTSSAKAYVVGNKKFIKRSLPVFYPCLGYIVLREART